MKTLAFILPCYTDTTVGTAENQLHWLVESLHTAGVSLEVLTTCDNQFGNDWICNYYTPGIATVSGITVHRFRTDFRHRQALTAIHEKLGAGTPLSPEEESIVIGESVNSDELYNYIRHHRSDYSLFVVGPWPFGTTYYGALAAGQQAVLIPCLRADGYAQMSLLGGLLPRMRGVIFQSEAEVALAGCLGAPREAKQALTGPMIDTSRAGDADRFRQKFQITGPFLFCPELGPGAERLKADFAACRADLPGDLTLVLPGGAGPAGTAGSEPSFPDGIKELAIYGEQDFLDGCAASMAVCQPSGTALLPSALLDSWLCGRPVVVSTGCVGGCRLARDAAGGLCYSDTAEFAGCVSRLYQNPETADAIGRQGGRFVHTRYDYETVVRKYLDFLEALAENPTAK